MQKKLLFVTHHKCASSWLVSLLREIAEINDATFYTSHRGTSVACPESTISALTNADYRIVSKLDLETSVHVIRNPMSVVASAYYSHLRTHSTDGWDRLVRQRALLENCSREEGLFLTLPFLWQADFYPETEGPLGAMTRWDYDDTRFKTIRMEDLTSEPNTTMRDVLDACGLQHWTLPSVQEFRFERFSMGRSPGNVDNQSHYRSGSAHAWRQELPMAVIGHVRAHCSDILRRFYPDTLI